MIARLLGRRDERGTATAFVVGMAITLLAMAGLVIDGGTALNQRMKLADDVEQAARAGALRTDEIALRSSGAIVLETGAARAAAAQYISSRGYTNAGINVTADQITVTATDTVDTVLLGLVGINSFDIRGTATAEVEVP